MHDELVANYRAGKPVEELAESHGISLFTMYARLREAGEPLRGHYRSLAGNEEEAVALYRADVPAKEIAKRYNCSQSTLFRYLKKWGLDPHSMMVGRRHKTVGKEDEIVALFDQDWPVVKIARHLGSHSGAVAKVLLASGRKPLHRRNPVNEAFFDEIATPEQAWVLGFLQADGCNDVKAWSVHCKDRDAIEQIKLCTSYDGPIREIHPKRGKTQYGIYVGSQRMTTALSRLGCVPRKSYVGWLPGSGLVSDALFSHYFRGLCDGDGSLTGPKGKMNVISIVGNENICKGLDERVRAILGIKATVRVGKANPNHTTWQYCVGSRRKLTVLLPWMYGGATVYMLRKRARALEYLTR